MEMTSVTVGIASVIAIVIAIYSGVHIAIALGMISFVGVVLLKNSEISFSLLSLAIADSVSEETFATVPLFVMMGLVVSRAGLGRDVYDFANEIFRPVRGGLGMATVAANAIFASVTGSSIASASVFAKVAIPEMLRFRYGRRFAVGIVAGSSVLGMIIPPSVMLIIYAVVTEQSVGAMFLAGVFPGILLAVAYCVVIPLFFLVAPRFVGTDIIRGEGLALRTLLLDVFTKLGPIVRSSIGTMGAASEPARSSNARLRASNTLRPLISKRFENTPLMRASLMTDSSRIGGPGTSSPSRSTICGRSSMNSTAICRPMLFTVVSSILRAPAASSRTCTTGWPLV